METSTSLGTSKVPKMSRLRQPTCNTARNVAKRPRIDTASSSTVRGAPAAGPSTSTTAASRSAATAKPSTRAGATSSRTGAVSAAAADTKSSKSLFTVGTNSASARAATQRNTKRSRSPAKNARPAPPAAKAGGKPKRAAWDTKGQLGDLREEFDQLRRELADKENQKQQLVVEKSQEISGAEARHSQQIASLTADKEAYQRQAERKEKELEQQITDTRKQLQTLVDQTEQQSTEIRLLKKEAAMLRLTQKENELELKEKSATNSTLTDQVAMLQEQLRCSAVTNRELEQGKRLHEMERRKLHNTIQELKGNIRVFARVRPSLQGAEREEIFSYPDPDSKKICLSRPLSFNESNVTHDSLKRPEKLDFAFDKVFEQHSTQEEVFDEISQLVQSALDGYNVCIFAYGQTGSGKTYTMQGPDDMTNDTTHGMIPRSIEQIFKSAEELRELGWQYTMVASFLEIYNDTVKDLLGQPGSNLKHEIKIASGEVVVTNLTTMSVTQPRQVSNLFERATKNRRVAETNCNVRSSRSHSVFTLKISGVNEVTSENCVGTLNLVDLAGSERLKESKSEGDRLKETQSINSSLSILGNVIMALASKKSHIPYRDSKLTFLLQHSLGGNSKTLMFVNLSPQEEHFNETVSSLRFATKVNSCSIGTAKKTVK